MPRVHRSKQHIYRSVGNLAAVTVTRTDINQRFLRNIPPFFPFTIEESHRENLFSFTDECCIYAMTVLLRTGQMLYEANGKNFLLKPGMLLFIPSGTTYSFCSLPDVAYDKLVLEFGGSELVPICHALNLDEMICLNLPDTSPLPERIRALKQILPLDQQYLPQILGTGFEILTHISMLARKQQARSPLFERAKYLLGGNLDQSLSVAEAARALRMSAPSLNRLFQKKMQLSPQKYRMLCRINVARDMLRHSELSIKEIAEKTGFCNQFYFSREFSRHLGESPSQFRKYIKGKVSPKK